MVNIESEHTIGEHHQRTMEHHAPQRALKQEETVTISKTTVWKAFSGVLAVLLAISVFTGGFGYGDGFSGGAAPSAAAPSGGSGGPSGAAVVDLKALADDDPVLGKDNAPVTIIEFSDYQCPFCRRFYVDTLPQLKKEYIDTGKVKLIFRDFPLSFHPGAQPAAEAAECADDQGKYWEMHDKIFEEQSKQGQGTVQFTADDLKTWAKSVAGLDYQRWESCFAAGTHRAEIRKDTADGTQAGVSGTPAFFVNGQLVSGAQPFAVFQQIIEAELR